MEKQGTIRKRPSVARKGGISYKKQQIKTATMIMLGIGTVISGFTYMPREHKSYIAQKKAARKRKNIKLHKN